MVNKIFSFNSEYFGSFSNSISHFISPRNALVATIAAASLACALIAKHYSFSDLLGRIYKKTNTDTPPLRKPFVFKEFKKRGKFRPASEEKKLIDLKLPGLASLVELNQFSSDNDLWKAVKKLSLDAMPQVLLNKLLAQNPRPSLANLKREIKVELLNNEVVKVDGFLLADLSQEWAAFKTDQEKVELATLSSSHFNSLIKSLYGSSPNSTKQARLVLSLAQKQNIPFLKDKAEKILIQDLEKIIEKCEAINDFKTQQTKINELALLAHEYSSKLLEASCHRFFQAFFKVPQAELNLSGWTGIKDEDIAYLSEWKDLRILNLAGCKNLTNRALSSIAQLSNLEEFSIAGCSQIDAGISSLAKCQKLQKLDLTACEKLSDNALASLGNLVNLTILSLGGCKNITDEGISYLKTCTKLQKLCLGNCVSLTDQALEHVSQFSSLEELDLTTLDGNSKFTSQGFAKLKDCPKLISLNLSFCEYLKDVEIEALSGCKELKKLDLSQCFSLDDSALKIISNFTNLEELDLRGCSEFTEQGFLVVINNCKKLQKLTLDFSNSQPNFQDGVLNHIGTSSTLKELCIVGFSDIQNKNHPTLKRKKLKITTKEELL